MVNDLELRRTHPLYSTLLADATFHELLLVFDQDIAIAARRGRCPLCSSVLHSAQYRRKPRGRPAGLGEEHDWRFSFCCARDGCRTRRTPVPRAQGLFRRDSSADRDHAGGRDHRADARAVRVDWRQPPDGRALHRIGDEETGADGSPCSHSSPLESPPQRSAAADRRPLHDDEARALHMLDKSLRYDLGHDLIGVVDALLPLTWRSEARTPTRPNGGMSPRASHGR